MTSSITLGGGHLAKMQVDGISTLGTELDGLINEISDINSAALYDAVGYVADEIKTALDGMPVRTEGRSDHRLYGATEREKSQIINGFGVSKHQKENGDITASIGFTGYVETPSKKYNNMVPTGMLMQTIEFGTAFRKGTHTITNASKQLKKSVPEVIDKRFQEEIEKRFK